MTRHLSHFNQMMRYTQLYYACCTKFHAHVQKHARMDIHMQTLIVTHTHTASKTRSTRTHTHTSVFFKATCRFSSICVAFWQVLTHLCSPGYPGHTALNFLLVNAGQFMVVNARHFWSIFAGQCWSFWVNFCWSVLVILGQYLLVNAGHFGSNYGGQCSSFLVNFCWSMLVHFCWSFWVNFCWPMLVMWLKIFVRCSYLAGHPETRVRVPASSLPICYHPLYQSLQDLRSGCKTQKFPVQSPFPSLWCYVDICIARSTEMASVGLPFFNVSYGVILYNSLFLGKAPLHNISV